MKRGIFVLILITALILTLSACTKGVSTENGNDTSGGNAASDSGSDEGTFVGSLKDALISGKSYRCTVGTTTGAATMLIKGKMSKLSFSEQGVTGSTITKEEGTKTCAYTITSAAGQSSCMKICMEIPTNAEAGNAQANGDASAAENSLRCSPVVISDSEFSVPSDCRELPGAPPGV